MRPLGLLMFLVCSGAAQGLPSSFFGLGGSFNGSSKPPVAGWITYAMLLSRSAQVYSVSTQDVFLSQTKPYTIITSARTGFATALRTIGPIVLLGLGDAGMAASGSTVGGAFSGGGVGILKIGHTNWDILAGGRVLKVANGGSQTVLYLGFGRSW